MIIVIFSKWAQIGEILKNLRFYIFRKLWFDLKSVVNGVRYALFID